MAQAAIPLPEARPPEDDAIIVVAPTTAVQTGRELDACLARHCAPKEDIEASLAHGEALFLNGDYAGARHVLAKSRGRNMRYARDLPVEVADLSRVYGRLSNLDGRPDIGRIAQIDSLDALKAGLDRTDARLLLQRMMVGDEFVRQGRLVAGDEIYRAVEKQAAVAKLPLVLGFSLLRQAVVYATVADADPTYTQQARHRIARLEHTTDPALAPFRAAVVLLRAQLAATSGDARALEAAIAATTQRSDPRPLLIFSPSIVIDERPDSGSTTLRNSGDTSPPWIDVAFRIEADGRVSNLAIIRRTDTATGAWTDRVVTAVANRRYAPPGPAMDLAQRHRIERFSLVYGVSSAISSRIRTRSPHGRIVSLDITAEPAPR